MSETAEDFNDRFENHKVEAAHRLRCLSDIAIENPLQIFADQELVAIYMGDKLYIDADCIELIATDIAEDED
jgi:hypothetical protein